MFFLFYYSLFQLLVVLLVVIKANNQLALNHFFMLWHNCSFQPITLFYYFIEYMRPSSFLKVYTVILKQPQVCVICSKKQQKLFKRANEALKHIFSLYWSIHEVNIKNNSRFYSNHFYNKTDPFSLVFTDAVVNNNIQKLLITLQLWRKRF